MKTTSKERDRIKARRARARSDSPPVASLPRHTLNHRCARGQKKAEAELAKAMIDDSAAQNIANSNRRDDDKQEGKHKRIYKPRQLNRGTIDGSYHNPRHDVGPPLGGSITAIMGRPLGRSLTRVFPPPCDYDLSINPFGLPRKPTHECYPCSRSKVLPFSPVVQIQCHNEVGSISGTRSRPLDHQLSLDGCLEPLTTLTLASAAKVFGAACALRTSRDE